MANNVYATICDSRSTAINRLDGRLKRTQQRFEPISLLDFVGADISSALLNTSHGNRCVVVLTDSYKKPTRAIPTNSAAETTVAQILLVHWVSSYEIPPKVLTDNDA